MADKKSFVLYHDEEPAFAMLSDEDAGKMIKAIFRYSVAQEEPEGFSDVLKMAFAFIRPQMDRDREKWADTCKKRAEAGRKGGEAKEKNRKQANLANASKSSKCHNDLANLADNDNENVNDNEKIYSAFFNRIWAEYPLKRGKAAVKVSQIKKLYAIGYEKLHAAIQNYKNELSGNSWQSEMHGSTFFNGKYEDYMPDVYEPAEVRTQQPETYTDDIPFTDDTGDLF